MSSRQEQAESDTGGAGRFRGRMAIEREWTLLEGEADPLIRSDRRDYLPYGLSGGQSGSSSVLHATDVSETILPVMVSTRINKNEHLYHRQPGTGGHGNPFFRDPNAIAWDVRNDRVSAQTAREKYGVVVDPVSFEVDQQATQDLRNRFTSAHQE